jgi:hypothetical protein
VPLVAVIPSARSCHAVARSRAMTAAILAIGIVILWERRYTTEETELVQCDIGACTERARKKAAGESLGFAEFIDEGFHVGFTLSFAFARRISASFL